MKIHERRWRYMYVLKCLCKSVGSELSTGGPNAHPAIYDIHFYSGLRGSSYDKVVSPA